MKMLFICTGNTCRSPMAKGLFDQLLAERGITDITCDSAGLFANAGEPAAENAVVACLELGVDLSVHRSKTLTREMLQSADLFVVMMQSHAGVLQSAGVPQEKIKVLGGGVGDPFGGSLAIYRASRDQIQKALEELLQELGY
ncbi:arsenate reductase/protein-tyrosine-phosphatase family protein [Faecalispora anaeroviscerum]|uniref:arsenate reductase/protein-tyrosine-phosphatase family protein n=1 Tax=Faecalispora anaeroviscerum TaxID=2991836 RepID=UPI0024BB58B8|nr:low molecular weight phosphatase family protein [Faecalispora anaeroviscerum]